MLSSKNGSGPGNGGGSSDGPGPGTGGPPLPFLGFVNGFVRGLGLPGFGLLPPPSVLSVSSVVSSSVFKASIQVFRSGQLVTGDGL